ncbi:MAG: S1 RNA-binding domain-containing protein, partial [bacterium]
MEKAVTWIKNIVKDPEPGEVYDGKITRLMEFGAFAEILPGKEGLIHISEMSTSRVNRVEDVVKEGDIVPVKVIEIDDRGRLNLSMKRMQDDWQAHDTRPEGDARGGNRPDRRNDRGRNDRRDSRSRRPFNRNR